MGVSVILYLDSILVPLSVFFTIGYHAYLLHNVKNKPLLTSIGFNTLKRRAWIQQLNQGDDKKGMLVVQSLRNTLMYAILSATVTALILVSLAAITNNAFKANHILFTTSDAYLLGSQTSRIMVLKYGSASIFLIASFLCSSVAVGSLVDANFLMNAIGEFAPAAGDGGNYTVTVAERGFAMAVVGNRLLCVAVTLLLWMLGPLAVVVSSVALVWGLHQLDFVHKLRVKYAVDRLCCAGSDEDQTAAKSLSSSFYRNIEVLIQKVESINQELKTIMEKGHGRRTIETSRIPPTVWSKQIIKKMVLRKSRISIVTITMIFLRESSEEDIREILYWAKEDQEQNLKMGTINNYIPPTKNRVLQIISA